MEVVVTVEGLDNTDNWKLIKSFVGEEDEVVPQAKAVQQEWLDKGFPKSDLRISIREFQSGKKRWVGE